MSKSNVPIVPPARNVSNMLAECKTVVQALGCLDGGDAEVLECLRELVRIDAITGAMTRLPLLKEQWVAWAAFRPVPTLYLHCARSHASRLGQR